MTVSPEHGKRYSTRDGRAAGPIAPHFGGWICKNSGLVWRSDGRYLGYSDGPRDLVSEYIEPTTEPAWIEWHGGECPIKSGKTLVDYRLANSIIRRGIHGRRVRWSRDMAVDDIISYRIIEDHEPAEPAPIDMSQNRVQWELLTDAEKAEIESWVKGGKKVVRLIGHSSQWIEAEAAKVSMYPNMIYRTVSPPVITETVHGVEIDGHTVTINLTRHDGKPISGTVVV